MRFSRVFAFIAVGLLLAPFAAHAQGGPPPHVRAAVDATVEMLQSEGDAPLAAYIETQMAPEVRTRTGLADDLRALRAAAPRPVNGISVEPAPDGVIVDLSGPNGEARYVIALSVEGILGVRAEATGPALTLTRDNLREVFDGLAQQGFSGAIYVVRDGEVLLDQGYGAAALGAPINADTAFGIGSTPITFTRAAIQLLEQRGVLSMSDPIRRFFPDAPRDKRAITIGQLMSSRSGLPDFFHTDADWNADLAWIDRDEAVRRIFAAPLLFAPGSQEQHSHAAYNLLAALIERATGESYYNFLRANFFDPAGMTRTGLYGETRGLSAADFAAGPGPSIVGAPNIPPNWGPTSWLVMGSGGMFSSLADMRRFYAYVRSDGVFTPERRRAYTGVSFDIGGSDQGFFIVDAHRGTENAVLMLTNMSPGDPAMRGLPRAIERFLGF